MARRLLWQDVYDGLAAEIAAGAWPVGSLLPGQPELAGRFSVSEGTVRNAMRELQQAGLVRKERGRGTVVLARQAALTLEQRVAVLEAEVARLRRTRHPDQQPVDEPAEHR